MNYSDPTRREVLRTGAGLAVVGTAGSTAGCLGSIPLSGAGSGNYTNWIPAAEEFQEDESLNFSLTNNSVVANNEDSFNEDYYDDQLEQDVDPLDIDFEDITFNLSFGPYQIYDGDYDENDVIDALEDDATGSGEFNDEGEYEGYTVYLLEDAADDPEIAYGVNGTTVVRAFSTSEEENAEDVLEITIDANNGNEIRFVGENEDFRLLTDELGSGTWIFGQVSEDAVEEENIDFGEFEGQIGSGSTFRLNGENTDAKFVFVYENENDVEDSDLEDYFEESIKDNFDPDDDPTYSTSGRVGTIEFSFDTDELDS